MRPVTVNWSLIDGAWRAGILSIRSIADEYTKLTGKPVSPSGIRKHYTELGVARDLTSRINARAQELVNIELVHELVHTETVISEDEIVDINAQQHKVIILTERRDVARVRRILMQLLDDLEDQVMNRELYENLGEIMQSPDRSDHDKLNDFYLRVISFPGRVKNMKKLADSLKTLVDLERRIYKLDEKASEGSVEDFLRKARS
jgi:hypothetical protein